MILEPERQMIDNLQTTTDVGGEVHPQKKHRRYRISDEITGPKDPYKCNWYYCYVLNPKTEEPLFHKIFRYKFRITFNIFKCLTEELENCDLFSRWHSGRLSGDKRRSVPLSLLILAAMRYLGRSETLDTLSEHIEVGAEVIRNFIHIFLIYGSETLYERLVIPPSTVEEAVTHSHEYNCAGFPGAIGSTDATHVELRKVPYSAKNAHLGFKSSRTTRTYNITVNHRRRILATTIGHPGTWNDQNISQYDTFMNSLQDGTILDGIQYKLYAYDKHGNIVQQKYKGGWLLVDNGYGERPTLIPPIKFHENTGIPAQRFSKWLESVRKDVECTFGSMKQRFTILSYGIRLHGTSISDIIFKTCCAIHNWILEDTNYDLEWDDGIVLACEVEDGNYDPNTPIGRIYSIGNQQNDENNENIDPNINSRSRTTTNNHSHSTTTNETNDHSCSTTMSRSHRTMNNHSHSTTTSRSRTTANDHSRLKTTSRRRTTTTSRSRTTTDSGDTINHNLINANDTSIYDSSIYDTPIDIRKMKRESFRNALIDHFDIAFQRGEVVWPVGSKDNFKDAIAFEQSLKQY
jgi:hypothetical protein